MNFYELIYLKNEFKTKLINGKVSEIITPFKNLLEIYIDTAEKSFRLIFSCSPGNTALFLDSYRPGKKANKLLFFESIYNIPITDIILAENDRMLTFKFEGGRRILFKLFSNKANALLISNGIIEDSFKDHGEKGEPEPNSKKVSFFTESKDVKTVEEKLIIANPLLSRSEVRELVSSNELNTLSGEEVVEFAKALTTQLSEKPVYRKLESGITTLISQSFLNLPTMELFDSVNSLVAFRFKNYSHIQRLKQQKSIYRKSIQRQLKRLKSSLSKLKQADKGIEKSKIYEKYGHLLMANAHLQVADTPKIVVSDLYDEGKEISIPLQSELSIVENAEHFYQRSSNSQKSYEEALKRVPILEERESRLQKMVTKLEEINHLRDFEDWKKRYKKEIENLGIGNTKKEEANLPFHTLEIQGFQVWIGKNARSNDKLIQFSHKEDIWMHARGVPGSHLIIRMSNNKKMPPKNIIEEAASYAAFNSKAKGASLVPVIFTKRKFVRKPKGAAPGTVLVQKEEVELVKPKKPIL